MATRQNPSQSTATEGETPAPAEPETPPEDAGGPVDQPVDAPEHQSVEVMPGASESDLRAEVRRLRDEAAGNRVGARRADDLAGLLVEAYAASTRLLADPSDLRVDDPAALLGDNGLPDPAKVTAAVETLIAAKPHLASRTPRGDIDQGARDDAPGVSLAGLLRAGA